MIEKVQKLPAVLMPSKPATSATKHFSENVVHHLNLYNVVVQTIATFGMAHAGRQAIRNEQEQENHLVAKVRLSEATETENETASLARFKKEAES